MQSVSAVKYAFKHPPLRFCKREPYCQTTFGAFSTQQLKADALANRDLVDSLFVSGMDTTLSADEVSGILKEQLGKLVSVSKVQVLTYRNSAQLNGCAIVELADKEDCTARAQVQAILQPAAHQQLQIPIQPRPHAIPSKGHTKMLGCPQIAPFSGHSRINREHSAGNRTRIYCEQFRNSTATAAMHILRLNLCNVADQDPMDENTQGIRATLLSALQFIQPTVSKPDSYRDSESCEAAGSDYINVMLLSKDSVLALAQHCQGDSTLTVGTLQLRVTPLTCLPRPDSKLELRFDIGCIMDSFSAELPTEEDQRDPDFLNPLNYERKGIILSLLTWSADKGLDVNLLGEGLDDCFIFIKPRHAVIAFRTIADKHRFMDWHKDGKPFFTTKISKADVHVSKLSIEDQQYVDRSRSARTRQATAEPDAVRQRNFERRDRSKRRKAVGDLASLKLG